jgi:hypothetical protein
LLQKHSLTGVTSIEVYVSDVILTWLGTGSSMESVKSGGVKQNQNHYHEQINTRYFTLLAWYRHFSKTVVG